MDIRQKIIKQNQERQKGPYRYLIFFAMLCMMTMLCKSLFSYLLINVHGYTLQAGQFIAPLWFLESDMIAEIYHYAIAKQVLIAGFICQILFTLIIIMLLHLPHAASPLSQAYELVFSNMGRITCATLIAFMVSGFINIKLITWLRFITQGKFFWARSIGASGVAEFFYSTVATFIIQYGKQATHTVFLIILASFSLKILYSFLLAYPASRVVNKIKELEGIQF